MRPIKFRAWDEKTKQMFYEMKHIPHLEIDALDIHSCLPYQHYILMQFTGLKAKGKEIYEGDIIEWKAYQAWHRDKVIFNDGKFHCYLRGFKEKYQEIYPLGLIVKCDCEVIGNIYENSNLIKNNETTKS